MIDVSTPYNDARQALRSIWRARAPQSVLNWREANFYGRYGEVELHFLEFLCRRNADAIDVGANDGSYVHYLRRHARHVHAFEPMPHLADALRAKFRRRVTVEAMALSDSVGTAELHMPVVDGVVVTGCSTISSNAAATYSSSRGLQVPMEKLDNVYRGDVGFIKIDVEGHEHAVLGGAMETIRRCRPRLLVELDERLAPGCIERAYALFTDLGYRGFFFHAGHVQPMERFSIDKMQDRTNLPDLTAPLQARARFGRYVYNFIFLPLPEVDPILMKVTDRLLELTRR